VDQPQESGEDWGKKKEVKHDRREPKKQKRLQLHLQKDRAQKECPEIKRGEKRGHEHKLRLSGNARWLDICPTVGGTSTCTTKERPKQVKKEPGNREKKTQQRGDFISEEKQSWRADDGLPAGTRQPGSNG